MFRKILVPIDGSETSNLGLMEAVELAKDQNATLCLLHVVDELTLAQICANAYVPLNNVEEFIDGLMEGGRKLLGDAEASVRDRGVALQSALVATMGRRVADVILDKAREWRVDLIVLGTHGRRGWNRLVMGSDAESVIRSTPVPVLLVRGPQSARAGAVADHANPDGEKLAEALPSPASGTATPAASPA